MAPIKKRYDELVRVGESLIFKFFKKRFPLKTGLNRKNTLQSATR